MLKFIEKYIKIDIALSCILLKINKGWFWMAARLFQSILLEVKDKVDFILGVVDNSGMITACTELKFIGESIEAAVSFSKSGWKRARPEGTPST